jgi:hypothetical protein
VPRIQAEFYLGVISSAVFQMLPYASQNEFKQTASNTLTCTVDPSETLRQIHPHFFERPKDARLIPHYLSARHLNAQCQQSVNSLSTLKCDHSIQCIHPQSKLGIQGHASWKRFKKPNSHGFEVFEKLALHQKAFPFLFQRFSFFVDLLAVAVLSNSRNDWNRK